MPVRPSAQGDFSESVGVRKLKFGTKEVHTNGLLNDFLELAFFGYKSAILLPDSMRFLSKSLNTLDFGA